MFVTSPYVDFQPKVIDAMSVDVPKSGFMGMSTKQKVLFILCIISYFAYHVFLILSVNESAKTKKRINGWGVGFSAFFALFWFTILYQKLIPNIFLLIFFALYLGGYISTFIKK